MHSWTWSKRGGQEKGGGWVALVGDEGKPVDLWTREGAGREQRARPVDGWIRERTVALVDQGGVCRVGIGEQKQSLVDWEEEARSVDL